MKKMICLLTALLLCCSFAMPAFAAADAFVPSITYKDGPEVKTADLNSEKVDDCLVVTSILEAKNKSTDIYQEERDLLLEVYDLIKKGDMDLPVDKGYEVVELVDVSFEKTDCVENETHGHQDELNKEDVTVTVDLETSLSKNAKLKVFVYDAEAEKWVEVENVKVNANGTVTCEFDILGVVMFCVEDATGAATPNTGDMVGQNLGLWIGVMVVCVAGLAAMMFLRKKKA